MEDNKRIFAVIVYGIVFIFSIFAIFQTRVYLAGYSMSEIKGNLNVIFFKSGPISQEEFIYFKLTMFFVTACLSFIMMSINFFLYENHRFDSSVMHKVDNDIRDLRKTIKKKN